MWRVFVIAAFLVVVGFGAFFLATGGDLMIWILPVVALIAIGVAAGFMNKCKASGKRESVMPPRGTPRA